jgi:hypothetical protein
MDDLNQPQVRTGTRASAAGPAAYKEGQVSLPNQGQVTTVDLDELSPKQAESPVDHSYSTELIKEIPWAAGQFGNGAARGLLHTATALPAYVASKIAPNSPQLQERERMNEPENPVQSIGHGVEQAGEFMLPGLGEEKAVSLLPEKLASLGRIGYQALTSGGVNAAQGGGFGTGAAAGALMGAMGEGMRAAAPGIAEKALGMRGTDRAFGKTPGRAILDETSGVRPESVATSAKERIGQLTPELENKVDAASVRPNPIRGFLPAPSQDIPLHSAGGDQGRLSQPVIFNQPDRPMPRGLPAPAHDIPLTANPFYGAHPPDEGLGAAAINNSRVGESMATPEGNPNYGYSDQFPSAEGKWTGGILRRVAAGEPASGMGPGQYIGEIPGERGGPSQVQGIWRRQQARLSGAIPKIKPFIPKASASLAPARDILSEALGKATAQNAEGLHGQIGGMQDFLSRRFGNREPIPENVTPRDLLNLKRGFSEEHLGWNPDRRDAALSTGRRAYGALDSELDRSVPEAAGLNQRISSLIPTVRRGEAMARGEGAGPRIMERIARPTGALTGAIGGGMLGYRQGGATGAAEGAGLGLILPELMTSPTGRMALARALNRPLPAFVLPAIRGGALQLDRGKK